MGNQKNDTQYIHGFDLTKDKVVSRSWKTEQVEMLHTLVSYQDMGTKKFHNENERVNMHFGLKGSYQFYHSQLRANYDLSGHHNNLMYSDGLDIEVSPNTKNIETFGLNFNPEAFIQFTQSGNDSLKKMAEKVMKKEAAILSPTWKTTPFLMQQVIQEILKCQFENDLRDLFLLSKSLELLVFQAELYADLEQGKKELNRKEIANLIAAKEILEESFEEPPNLSQLADRLGLSIYFLKKEFQQLFGLTIFNFIHQKRMGKAKSLLLNTQMTAKEIAYETGYSSPQYFSKAFKREFGVSPNSIRKNPQSAMN